MNQQNEKALSNLLNFWYSMSYFDEELFLKSDYNFKNIQDYDELLQDIEFFILEGQNNPEHRKLDSEKLAWDLTRVPFAERTNAQKLEILKLFVKTTEMHFQRYNLVPKEMRTRLARLSGLNKESRTDAETEELNKIAQYIYSLK